MISVLFVDDEPVLLDIGRLFLERAGDFSVTGADSAEKAMELLSENSFDAVVADYEMPRMNGIDLLRHVRQSYGDLPFILFTGRGREDVAGDALNIGANFYIQKGGDPKLQFTDLANGIEKAVARRKTLQAVRASEQRFYDIINFLPDATFAIDTTGKIIAWNREIEHITNTRASDMMGKKNYAHSIPFYGKRRPMIADLVLNQDPEFESSYPSLHREDGIITAEGALHLSGKKHYFLARASILYDQSGRPAGAIESLRDISRQKRSEEKLSRIISLLPFGLHVFRLDNDGNLLCCKSNPASEKITGISGVCTPGRPITEIFSGSEGLTISAECRRIAESGGRTMLHAVQLKSDTSMKEYDLSIFQIDPGEVVVMFIGSREEICGSESS